MGNELWLVKFPIMHDMSPITYKVRDKPMETKEEEALWHYNHSREHDGLSPLDELPIGTEFLLDNRSN